MEEKRFVLWYIFVLPRISGIPLSISICVRSESAMSRKGIGDRVKAKTNVATVRLASALGFQVLIKSG